MHAEDIHSVLDLMALPIPDFVSESYRLLLGRQPDALELKERTGVIRAGLGRERFLTDMSVSPEFEQHHDQKLHGRNDKAFVEGLFKRYLGRSADLSGLNHYTGLLAKGRSRDQILRNIATSREARVKGTFWYELDRLLADERAERHWISRWFGRSKRRGRQINRMQEVILHHSISSRRSLPDLSTHAQQFVGVQNIGNSARQVLSRLRQSTGGA